MPAEIAAATAMLVLFPGFVGLKILEAATDYRQRTEFDKLGVVVGFSLVIYMAYFGLALAFGLPHVPASYSSGAFGINGWSVLAIALLSVVMPLVVGVVTNRGWLTRINYRGWIADRDFGGPASVWVGAFSDCREKWIRVHLENGTVLQGYAKWYSDNGEEHEVFLGEASIRLDEAGFKPVLGPGILVAGSASVSYVEFLDGD